MNTASRPFASPRPPAAPRERSVLKPVVLWAGVVLLAMMSFYVHLLNEQVARGERMRQVQRDGTPDKVVAQPRQASTLRVSQTATR